MKLLGLLLSYATLSLAQEKPDLLRATQPLAEGVPQVAVVRLRALLARKLPEEERRAATAKLGEALVAAGEANEALNVLGDTTIAALPATTFFRAQALAALSRWTEALPLYQRVAVDSAFPLQAEALAGQGEALRALGRAEEALQTFELLARHKRWRTRALFRSAELLLAKNNLDAAARRVESVETRSASEQREWRFLRGSIEAKRGNHDGAIDRFAWILKNPQGAAHSVVVAALFAIAQVHLDGNTPGVGVDFLEDFIEDHPGDAELPTIFAKLDQLYAAQRKQSRHELGR